VVIRQEGSGKQTMRRAFIKCVTGWKRLIEIETVYSIRSTQESERNVAKSSSLIYSEISDIEQTSFLYPGI
jgi:hypothetical protein